MKYLKYYLSNLLSSISANAFFNWSGFSLSLSDLRSVQYTENMEHTSFLKLVTDQHMSQFAHFVIIHINNVVRLTEEKIQFHNLPPSLQINIAHFPSLNIVWIFINNIH